MSHGVSQQSRSATFAYEGWSRDGSRVSFHFNLGGNVAREVWEFDQDVDWSTPGLSSLLDLLAALVGLSYYKLGAAPRIDLGPLALSASGRALLHAALLDGLGEFAYRNDLDLSDVQIGGGIDVESVETPSREGVLIPFGGGIDSIVTLEGVRRHHPVSLFVVSPTQGRFAPLEETLAVTGLEVRRATRQLDLEVLRGPGFTGHVPVTAIITLASAVVALGTGMGSVAMSNEYSASIPNVVSRGCAINHQWSKSLVAEELISRALRDTVGSGLFVASALRDRSEIWVAEQFSRLEQYHAHFRSCNRAFAHDPTRRASQWCGECDKCLFIDLVLAPFVPRERLRAVLGIEPLSSPALARNLETLVGLGDERKPFECVGDPDECAVALQVLAHDPDWSDVDVLRDLASRVEPSHLSDHLRSRGVSHAPRTWLL
ncbi:MAG: hypothetical protein HKL87_03475 [Acidimicrobiaceae bacterium]|nr:hypothetical protein [Acidimicrobiaceae bacterium]